jgi:hypothetical protein
MTSATTRIRTATIAAFVAVAAPASSAPIGAPAGLSSTPATAVVYRGGNWGRSQLDAPGAWAEHNRQWDAREGISSAVAACARRYGNAYDRNSRTYVGRDGRRHRCPR